MVAGCATRGISSEEEIQVEYVIGSGRKVVRFKEFKVENRCGGEVQVGYKV